MAYIPDVFAVVSQTSFPLYTYDVFQSDSITKHYWKERLRLDAQQYRAQQHIVLRRLREKWPHRSDLINDHPHRLFEVTEWIRPTFESLDIHGEDDERLKDYAQWALMLNSKSRDEWCGSQNPRAKARMLDTTADEYDIQITALDPPRARRPMSDIEEEIETQIRNKLAQGIVAEPEEDIEGLLDMGDVISIPGIVINEERPPEISPYNPETQSQSHETSQRPRKVSATPSDTIEPGPIPSIRPLDTPSSGRLRDISHLFTRIRRHIKDPTKIAEFYDLVRLYMLRGMSRSTYVERARSYVGSSANLMACLRLSIGLEEQADMKVNWDQILVTVDPSMVGRSIFSLPMAKLRPADTEPRTTCSGKDFFSYLEKQLQTSLDEKQHHLAWFGTDGKINGYFTTERGFEMILKRFERAYTGECTLNFTLFGRKLVRLALRAENLRELIESRPVAAQEVSRLQRNVPNKQASPQGNHNEGESQVDAESGDGRTASIATSIAQRQPIQATDLPAAQEPAATSVKQRQPKHAASGLATSRKALWHQSIFRPQGQLPASINIHDDLFAVPAASDENDKNGVAQTNIAARGTSEVVMHAPTSSNLPRGEHDSPSQQLSKTRPEEHRSAVSELQQMNDKGHDTVDIVSPPLQARDADNAVMVRGTQQVSPCAEEMHQRPTDSCVCRDHNHRSIAGHKRSADSMNDTTSDPLVSDSRPSSPPYKRARMTENTKQEIHESQQIQPCVNEPPPTTSEKCVGYCSKHGHDLYIDTSIELSISVIQHNGLFGPCRALHFERLPLSVDDWEPAIEYLPLLRQLNGDKIKLYWEIKKMS
ncbi:Transcriptional regulatory protein sin3 [Lithohypha guttulata]|uniref:Transcriptional regulatory protein sin3 n=1 Tax=Lithohypha guttulata TaxID=1690604 RepID=A0AAN7SXW3_9EURO|nr:Transcriptional regulatory protein sin3 [Lithohypha guttulata]